MSNNVMQFPQKTRKSLGRKIALYSAVVLVVLLMLLLTVLWEPFDMDRMLRAVHYGSGREITYESYATNSYAMCGDTLAISSGGNVKLCSFSKETLLETVHFSSPAAVSCGKYALCWDVGGRQFVLADGSRNAMVNQTINGDLLDADVSKTGIYSIASSEGGYKTVLRIFGKNGKETFRWFSASQFLPQCACSPDGQNLAAVSFGIENGNYQSKLLLFRTDKDQIAETVSISEALVYDMRYIGNNTLCVVSEDGVRFFEGNGKLRGEWLFPSNLVDFDFTSDRFVLLAFDAASSAESTTLVALDTDADVLGETTVGGKCRGLSTNGRYAGLLTDQAFLLYRRDLTPYARFSEAAGMRAAFARADGSAVLIGDKKAELVLPR